MPPATTYSLEKFLPEPLYGPRSPLHTLCINHEEILKALKRLDIHKGAGSDGIPPLFIVSCASALVAPLHILFNRS